MLTGSSQPSLPWQAVVVKQTGRVLNPPTVVALGATTRLIQTPAPPILLVANLSNVRDKMTQTTVANLSTKPGMIHTDTHPLFMYVAFAWAGMLH